MPVLFLGHGSPMNAIHDNAFTRMLNVLGRAIGKPTAILCVSAHWLTDGARVTHMANPRTIHDFNGFPKPLFDVEYPAPGSPTLAERVKEVVKSHEIRLDDVEWGLDHGAWSVLKHMYPEADVPVVQLSLDLKQPTSFHHGLGMSIKPLRDENVLIIGSGNIVHNLRTIRWDPGAEPYGWAVEFDAWVKDRLLAGETQALIRDVEKTEAGRLSVPTPDHYLPFLSALGATDRSDRIMFPYEAIDLGSISMRCVTWGFKGA